VTVSLDSLSVRVAIEADAAELLVLQRCCWVQEALPNDTLDTPPLRETLDEVTSRIDESNVSIVCDGHRFVGAVRVRLIDRTWEIGVRVVHRRAQQQKHRVVPTSRLPDRRRR
jgi:hypothetical protein